MNPQRPPEGGDNRKRKITQQENPGAHGKPDSTFSGIKRWLTQGSEGEAYEYSNIPVVDVSYTPKDDDDFLSSMSSPRSEKELLSSINSGDEGLLTSGDEFLSCASDIDEERFLSADEEVHVSSASDIDEQSIGSKKRKMSVPKLAIQTTCTPVTHDPYSSLSFESADNSWYDGNQTVIRKSISPSKSVGPKYFQEETVSVASQTSSIVLTTQKEVTYSAHSHKSTCDQAMSSGSMITIPETLKSGLNVAASAYTAVRDTISQSNDPPDEEANHGNVGIAGALKGTINIAAAAPAPATAMYGGVHKPSVKETSEESGHGLGIVSAIKNVISVATGSTEPHIAGANIGSALRGVGDMGVAAIAPHTASDEHRSYTSATSHVAGANIGSALRGIGDMGVAAVTLHTASDEHRSYTSAKSHDRFSLIGTSGNARAGAIGVATYKQKDTTSRMHVSSQNTSNVNRSSLSPGPKVTNTPTIPKDGNKVANLNIPCPVQGDKSNISYIGTYSLAHFTSQSSVSKDNNGNTYGTQHLSRKGSEYYSNTKDMVMTSSSVMAKVISTTTYGQMSVPSHVNVLPSVSRKKDNVAAGCGTTDLWREEIKKSFSPAISQGTLVDKMKGDIVVSSLGVPPVESTEKGKVFPDTISHAPVIGEVGRSPLDGTSPYTSSNMFKVSPAHTISPLSPSSKSKEAHYGTLSTVAIEKAKIGQLGKARVAPSHISSVTLVEWTEGASSVNTISPVPSMDRAKTAPSHIISSVGSADRVKISSISTISHDTIPGKAKLSPSHGILPVALKVKTKVAHTSTMLHNPPTNRGMPASFYNTIPLSSDKTKGKHVNTPVEKTRVAPVNTASPAKVFPYDNKGFPYDTSAVSQRVSSINTMPPAPPINKYDLAPFSSSPAASIGKAKIAPDNTILSVPSINKASIAQMYNISPILSTDKAKEVHCKTHSPVASKDKEESAPVIITSPIAPMSIHTISPTATSIYHQTKITADIYPQHSVPKDNKIADVSCASTLTLEVKASATHSKLFVAYTSSESSGLTIPMDKTRADFGTVSESTMLKVGTNVAYGTAPVIAKHETKVPATYGNLHHLTKVLIEKPSPCGIVPAVVRDAIKPTATIHPTMFSGAVCEDNVSEKATRKDDVNITSQDVGHVTKDDIKTHATSIAGSKMSTIVTNSSPLTVANVVGEMKTKDLEEGEHKDVTVIPCTNTSLTVLQSNTVTPSDMKVTNIEDKCVVEHTTGDVRDIDAVSDFQNKERQVKANKKKKRKRISEGIPIVFSARKRKRDCVLLHEIFMQNIDFIMSPPPTPPKSPVVKTPKKSNIEATTNKASKKKEEFTAVKSLVKTERTDDPKKTPIKKTPIKKTSIKKTPIKTTEKSKQPVRYELNVKSPIAKSYVKTKVKLSSAKGIVEAPKSTASKSVARKKVEAAKRIARKKKNKSSRPLSKTAKFTAIKSISQKNPSKKTSTVKSASNRKVKSSSAKAVVKAKKTMKGSTRIDRRGVRYREYNEYTDKDRMKIGKYASENGLAASYRKYMVVYEHLKYSTVQFFRSRYWNHLAMSKEQKVAASARGRWPKDTKSVRSIKRRKRPVLAAATMMKRTNKSSKGKKKVIVKVAKNKKTEVAATKRSSKAAKQKSKPATPREKTPSKGTKSKKRHQQKAMKSKKLATKETESHKTVKSKMKTKVASTVVKSKLSKAKATDKKKSSKPMTPVSHRVNKRYTGKERYIMGKYASEHGVTVCAKKYMKDGSYRLSTVRDFKKLYEKEIALAKKEKRQPVKQFNYGRKGRPTASKKGNTSVVKRSKSKDVKKSQNIKKEVISIRKVTKNSERVEKPKLSRNMSHGKLAYQPKYSWLSRYKNFYLVDNQRSTVTGNMPMNASVNKPSTSADNLSKTNSSRHFSHSQVCELERIFTTQKYISTEESKIIAEALDITRKQAMRWFNNRRMKWRKVMTELEDEVKVQLLHTS